MPKTQVTAYFAELLVYDVLSRAVEKDETIDSGKFFMINEAGRVSVDYYLEKGCHRLRIPKKAAVEVKSQLLFDTVERCVRLFYVLKEQGVDFFYLVVVEDIPKDINIKILPEGFRIVKLEYWMSELGDVSPRKHHAFISPQSISSLTEQRIKRAQVSIASGKSTFFLGAGVSQDAGLPGWNELLKRILSILNQENPRLKMRYSVLDSDAKRSSIIMARYIENAFDDPTAFKNAIKSALYKKAPRPSSLIKMISRIIKERTINTHSGIDTDKDLFADSGKRLGLIDSVITYNYDDYLEKQLLTDGVNCNSITKGNRVDSGAFPVYHVHGIIPSSETSEISDIVLTENSYHSIYSESYHWSNIEQLHSLGNTTCFFVGLSMLDPNLRRLVDQASDRDRNEAFHYAIMNQNEFEDVELADKMFQKLGVNTLWVDSYEDIPFLLERIFLTPLPSM